jgi:hypothetical protein
MAETPNSKQWIGTWAAAPQPPTPGQLQMLPESNSAAHRAYHRWRVEPSSMTEETLMGCAPWSMLYIFAP